MANYRRKIFTLVSDLAGSPLAQSEAIEFIAEAAGLKPRLVKAEAKALRKAQEAQPEDGASIEDACEGIAFVPPDKFWIRTADGREWERRGADGVALKLRERGLSGKRIGGEELSPLDRALLHVQDHQAVHHAGPLTAWRIGLHQQGTTRILVTRQPDFIEAKPGDPTPFLRMVDDLVGMGTDPHAATQKAVLLGWFKQWLAALDSAATDPTLHVAGQILVIAGPAGLGKSYFTRIAAKLGGDRLYDPEKSFARDSRFNAELATATLAAVGDASRQDRTRDAGELA